MFTKDALAYFAGNRASMVAALKIRPESTYDWGERVPDLRQLQLEMYTNGGLQAEDRLKPAPGQSSQRASMAIQFDAIVGRLCGVLRDDERMALAIAYQQGPEQAKRVIDGLDIAVAVRAQLLAAAQGLEAA